MVTCRGKVPGGAREVLLEGYDLAGLCIWSQPCKVESGRTVRLACIIPEGCCRLVARDCIGGEKLGECDLAVAHTGPFLLDIEP